MLEDYLEKHCDGWDWFRSLDNGGTYLYKVGDPHADIL